MTYKVWRSVFLTGLLTTISLSFCQITYAQAPATVIFRAGNPVVQHADGNEVALSKGDNLVAGDTILTRNGRLQFTTVDGGKISLQPNTIFKIKRYEFSGKEDGSEYAITELIKGGLRTITGLIGHKNRDRYQLQTPVATIGIRGTEFSVFYDTKLIMTTNHGSVDVCNAAGCKNAVTGQSISTNSNTDEPQYTTEIANVVAAPTSTVKPIFVQTEVLNAQREPVVIAQFNTPTNNTTTNTVNAVDILITSVNKNPLSNNHYALIDGTLTRNTNNNLTGFESNNSSIKLIAANFDDFYEDNFVTMGRTRGQINNQNVDLATYITGDITLPGQLTALANLSNPINYSVISSTAPVLVPNNGAVTQVANSNSVTGNMAINFATLNYNYGLNIPLTPVAGTTTTYNLDGNGSFTTGSANFSNTANLTTISQTSTSTITNSGGTADLYGRLIGAQAERVGLQYVIPTAAGSAAISGSAIMGKQ